MTINKKIIIILSIFFIGTIIVTFAISYLVIQREFLEIEKQTVSKNINRVINTLSNDIYELSYLNEDWSAWNDTYEFINNRDKDYIDSNLVDGTFTSLSLNLMMFVNSSGDIIHEKAFDLENEEEILVPEDIYEFISTNGILVNHSETESSITGVILLAENPILVASEPILTSNNEGPIRGTLIFGRYLDESVISSLAERTELTINVFRLDHLDEFNELGNVLSKITKENSFYIAALDRKNIAGYAIVEDIFGNPALLLEINLPRDIYRQSVTTFITYTSIIFIVCLFLGVLTLILLNRLFLKRLLKIGNDVKSIGKEKDISSRIIINGEDEIHNLATDINSMLHDLEKAQDKVKYLSFHDNLTDLYNRSYIEEEIARLNTERQLPLSITMGDLNALKLVNDAFGYRNGDKLLVRIAKILKKCSRKEDIIARWGGDEFLILLPKTTEEDAIKLIDRVREACERTTDQKVPISLSIGVSTKTRKAQNIQDIIKEAEDRMYQRKLTESKSIQSSIISSLEATLWERSHETEEHGKRLKELTLKLGRVARLAPNELDELALLSTLHDMGKIGIEDSILTKPEKLTKKEWEIMKRHPEIGYKIAQSSPQLLKIADGILYHHEWWDGTGYPHGLTGENIPMISRILQLLMHMML